MPASPAEESYEDPRRRAANTKRTRTRAALLAAADSAFSARPWAATRIEDIASAAGVSAATAYNHFDTKHVLIAEVFAPHVAALVVQAERDIARDRPVLDALSDQVRALARLSFYHRGLTNAFTAAVFEYTIRVGRTPDPDDAADPRTIAPLPVTLALLIQHGQDTGQLRDYPAAFEAGVMVVNLLLLRSINQRTEPPEVTSRLLETMLIEMLRP